MVVGCVEHVWELAGLGAAPDGRLVMSYACARCGEPLVVGPDDVPPGGPDLPV